jgi:hypothetical protein
MTDKPTPQAGDRIRVTYEGVYTEAAPYANGAIDLSGDGQAYGLLAVDLDAAAAVEILPPPEPPFGSVIVGWDTEAAMTGGQVPMVFCREGEQDDSYPWRLTGVTASHTYAQVCEGTRHGQRVFTPESLRQTP